MQGDAVFTLTSESVTSSIFLLYGLLRNNIEPVLQDVYMETWQGV